MWGKKKSPDGDTITLVSEVTEIRGDVIFRGSMHVEGRVLGNIQAHDGSLRLAEGSMVEGDIHVADVAINGTVKGDVFVAGKLELSSKADITGNVYYNMIEMALGAQVNGVLEHVNTRPDTVEAARELQCIKEPEEMPALNMHHEARGSSAPG